MTINISIKAKAGALHSHLYLLHTPMKKLVTNVVALTVMLV